MEPAVFRPPLRGLGLHLLLGALAGAGVALVTAIPPGLGLVFGAVAAALAVSLRHARALRVVADERGLRVQGGGAPLDGAWGELRVGFGLVQREDGAVQRYAAVADPAGRTLAFADGLRGQRCPAIQGADGRPAPILELREAPLLLALLVQRVPFWQVFPESLAPAPAPVPAPVPETLPEASTAPRDRRARPGLVGALAALASKLGAAATKLGAGALKAAKLGNVGWAAASVAAWSLLFTWKFAVAVMLQLVVHELGHVHAMRRTGMRVRGLYFVPLLGAMAVTDDAFTSRAQQARVALAGPLWGTAFTLLPLAAWAATGDPFWAAVATWWALLNLFNLLPISPLDGGRVVQAFACSFSSGVGLAASALGLACLVALATAVGFSLVWFVVALGALELLSEAQARQGARALRLLPAPARFATPHWLHLRAVLGSGANAAADAVFLHALERKRRAAAAEPMRAGGLVRWGLAYAALVVALLLLVHFLRHVPGAAAAAQLLE